VINTTKLQQSDDNIAIEVTIWS